MVSYCNNAPTVVKRVVSKTCPVERELFIYLRLSEI